MAKILLVEDERPLVKVIEDKLSTKGHAVTVATSADEGFEKLQAENFDAVWTDHYLTRGNGVELVTKMKGEDRLKNTPIFVISNTADGQDIYSYIQLGVTDYFVKSETRLDDIIGDIEEVLAKI